MDDADEWVIEFRSGSFFKDLESDRGCRLAEAKRFASEEDARAFMVQNEWILFNGGCALRRPKEKP